MEMGLFVRSLAVATYVRTRSRSMPPGELKPVAVVAYAKGHLPSLLPSSQASNNNTQGELQLFNRIVS